MPYNVQGDNHCRVGLDLEANHGFELLHLEVQSLIRDPPFASLIVLSLFFLFLFIDRTFQENPKFYTIILKNIAHLRYAQLFGSRPHVCIDSPFARIEVPRLRLTSSNKLVRLFKVPVIDR